MKKMIFLVAMAVASAAWAQAPAGKKDAPKPEAKAEPAKAAAKAEPANAAKAEPAKAQPQRQAKAVKKSRRTQDARHCLERPGNNEIIKCAEEFL